mmetsp:Transcript_13500/g.20305  ORF Transcript_13500/g.20305 Transcript_13500/m.20305 type:complete len:111 (+) Transcript_13500:148-480(+)
MWTFPINTPNTSSSDSPSPPSITIAQEVEPTACETECVDQQKSLVACVDSIRAAKLREVERRSDGSDDDGDTTSTDTPECLPMAVAAWTKCCEEANLRQREAQKEVESDD